MCCDSINDASLITANPQKMVILHTASSTSYALRSHMCCLSHAVRQVVRLQQAQDINLSKSNVALSKWCTGMAAIWVQMPQAAIQSHGDHPIPAFGRGACTCGTRASSWRSSCCGKAAPGCCISASAAAARTALLPLIAPGLRLSPSGAVLASRPDRAPGLRLATAASACSIFKKPDRHLLRPRVPEHLVPEHRCRPWQQVQACCMLDGHCAHARCICSRTPAASRVQRRVPPLRRHCGRCPACPAVAPCPLPGPPVSDASWSAQRMGYLDMQTASVPVFTSCWLPPEPQQQGPDKVCDAPCAQCAPLQRACQQHAMEEACAVSHFLGAHAAAGHVAARRLVVGAERPGVALHILGMPRILSCAPGRLSRSLLIIQHSKSTLGRRASCSMVIP